MTFNRTATRHWPRAVATALTAVALMAACGGGTSQFDPFVAQRVFAFGDDTSTLRTDGKRYGVNGLDATTSAFDCNLNPIWVQYIAGTYGYVFAECNTATTPAVPKAFMYAAAGAKVDDVAAQVQARAAAGGFVDKDLALVSAGSNDVWELYAQFPAVSEAALLTEIRARGDRMAINVVNRMVSLGAKVIVANLPDLGMTPFARAEAVANAASGFDRAALITRLSTAFNERLGVKVLLDGRYVGLAQLDLRTQALNRSATSFGFTDVSSAVCTAVLPDCTTATVTTGATPASFLWSDDKRLGVGGQSTLATLALERAQRNPF